MTHQFVPQDLTLPNYKPRLAAYGLGCCLLLILVISGKSPKLLKIDILLICWWAFCGLTTIVEGYYVLLLEEAKVWIENSKGDSRHSAGDAALFAFVVIAALIQGLTSLLAVYAIANGKSYSYILQFGVSVFQIVGYFVISCLKRDNIAAGSYYLLFISTFSSVVIPLLIAIRSWGKFCAIAEPRRI